MNLFVKLAGDLPAIEKVFPQSGGSFLFLRGNEEKRISFSVPGEAGKYIFSALYSEP